MWNNNVEMFFTKDKSIAQKQLNAWAAIPFLGDIKKHYEEKSRFAGRNKITADDIPCTDDSWMMLIGRSS
jgi:hypothetical protein